MKLSEWKQRVRTVFKEAEVPYYPEIGEAPPTSPIMIDSSVIEKLLSWASTASPEDIGRAVDKLNSVSTTGDIVDTMLLSDIIAAGDYITPMAANEPQELQPVTSVDGQQVDVAQPPLEVGSDVSPETGLVAEPELEPVVVPEVPLNTGLESPDVLPDEEEVDDTIEDPLVDDEEEVEEQDIKKSLFKSFF